MSNVVVGIIGTILFIGLAMSGASYLGTRFTGSTNDSRAVGLMQMVSQLAYCVDASSSGTPTGAPATDEYVSQMIDTGYMKYPPENRFNPANPVKLVTADGTNGSGRARYG